MGLNWWETERRWKSGAASLIQRQKSDLRAERGTELLDSCVRTFGLCRWELLSGRWEDGWDCVSDIQSAAFREEIHSRHQWGGWAGGLNGEYQAPPEFSPLNPPEKKKHREMHYLSDHVKRVRLPEKMHQFRGESKIKINCTLTHIKWPAISPANCIIRKGISGHLKQRKSDQTVHRAGPQKSHALIFISTLNAHKGVLKYLSGGKENVIVHC